ncbi:hypothetical protein [Salaquimonas pukyongi]|uniref:hypothetical protein n=1 Tax=Salaquimonas pukyongi TaxID=2712698 RepID=UPI00096BCEC0|nr:hypothetical protein [Salaquimonas pukyongi]
MMVDDMAATTEVARSAYAAELFDVEAIRRGIIEHAREGYSSYRIYQTMPFDLAQELPTQRLLVWLKAEGFQVAWQPTCEPGDPYRPLTAFEYPELEIFW